MTSYNSSNSTYFFNKDYGLLRESIQNLTFTNKKPSGEGKDISVLQDKSILLYYTLNGNKVKNSSNVDIDAYNVIIYSKNIVKAPKDSNHYFYHLKNVINLNFNNRFDTSNVTNMSYMFYFTGYTAMTTLDLGDKFDTLQVTNMQYMFYFTGYTAMTTLDLGDKFDTLQVTNMQCMFYFTGYTAMTTLDLGNKFDTSNVTNMQFMFSSTGYTAMTTLNLGPLFKSISTTNIDVFDSTGKSGCTIKVNEDIYSTQAQFKLGKDSTSTIDYTRGTLQKSYLNTTTE